VHRSFRALLCDAARSLRAPRVDMGRTSRALCSACVALVFACVDALLACLPVHAICAPGAGGATAGGWPLDASARVSFDAGHVCELPGLPNDLNATFDWTGAVTALAAATCTGAMDTLVAFLLYWCLPFVFTIHLFFGLRPK